MIVLEFKLKGKVEQLRIVDEAIRTAQFVRNKCLRFWMDNQGVKPYDLNKYCAVLAKEFSFASKLNSQARQSAAERAAFSIQRFFAKCKAKKPGKKMREFGRNHSPQTLRAIHSSRRIIVRLSTRRRDGSWILTASILPSPMNLKQVSSN